MPGFSGKYLQRQVDPELADIAAALSVQITDASIDHLLVVPACNEPIDFLTPLLDLCRANSALLILVLNEPQDAPASWRSNNSEFRESVIEKFDLNPLGQRGWFNESAGLLLLDYLGDRALARQEGVGLARKQGTDLAVLLINSGLCNNSWISITDADTTPPRDYFEIPAGVQASALLHPHGYLNSSDDRLNRATHAYNLRLIQYEQGLRQAGSPYAYTAHGSTLKVFAKDYVAAQGFPRRAAGEDFYLLNKLHKLGGVKRLAHQPVLLQPRCSDRVPFGTGPAVTKLVESEHMDDEPLLYDPRVFTRLAQLLQTLENHTPAQWQKKLAELNLADGFDHLNPESIKQHLASRWHNRPLYLKHLHDWMDAFRTLKFVQYQRAHGLPDLSLNQWQQQFGKLNLPPVHGQTDPGTGSFPAP